MISSSLMPPLRQSTPPPARESEPVGHLVLPPAVPEEPSHADAVQVGAASSPRDGQKPSGETSQDEVRSHHGPLWKRIADYVLHSAHILIEAAETAHVLAGSVLGGVVGNAVVSVGTSALGVSQIVEGVRDKSGEKVVEGVGGILIGAKSGIEAISLGAEHGVGIMHPLAHEAHGVLTALGVGHGAVEFGLGAYRVSKGIQSGNLGAIAAGAVTVGLGVSVCAASLGGGLPAVVASGLFLAGRIAIEESDKARKIGLMSAVPMGQKVWRMLD